MLKNILKLEGAQALNKTEQININGGGSRGGAGSSSSCPNGSRPLWGLCNVVSGTQIGYCAGGITINRPCS